MKYISAIINIVIGCLIFLFGYTGFSNYFGGAEKKVEQLETLLNQGETTMGMVDSMYSETTIKSITIYSSKYFFKVDGEKYEGSFTFDSPDELLPIIQVHYLPTDPNTNGVNIENDLAEARKKVNSKFDLWIGIGAWLIAFFLIYFRGIKQFLNPKILRQTA